MSDDYDAVMVCIGGKGHMGEAELRDMAASIGRVHQSYPEAPIMLVVDGYDDDPRELWNIPEAVRYVRRFAMASGLHSWWGPLFQALDEPSRALLIACSAIDEPHPHLVTT